MTLEPISFGIGMLSGVALAAALLRMKSLRRLTFRLSGLGEVEADRGATVEIRQVDSGGQVGDVVAGSRADGVITTSSSSTSDTSVRVGNVTGKVGDITAGDRAKDIRRK